MSIHVQGKGSGGMSQVALDGFHIVPVLKGENGKSVPIGYNKDKSENPVFSRLRGDK